jgi:hypothetical protein
MKLKMTVEDALIFSDKYSKGLSVHADSQGWRVVCMVLSEEVRKLRAQDNRSMDRQREISELLCIAHDYLQQHWNMDSAPLHKIDDFVKDYFAKTPTPEQQT